MWKNIQKSMIELSHEAHILHYSYLAYLSLFMAVFSAFRLFRRIVVSHEIRVTCTAHNLCHTNSGTLLRSLRKEVTRFSVGVPHRAPYLFNLEIRLVRIRNHRSLKCQ